MRRWLLPLVLLIIAAVAAWQAVRTDRALADETSAPPGPSAPSLTTPLLSARRTPSYLRGPTIIENLRNDLESLADESPSQSCLSVSIGGEEVFSDNPTLPLVPASTQKILTAYGAYELLGPEHQYETRVVTDAPVVDGVLDGSVWLIGGGDPLLATPEYVARYEEPHALTNVVPLADAVAAAGITEITGAIVGNEDRYDSERYVDDWPERFAQQNQTGPLSALTVNDGFVAFDPENTADALSTAAAEPAVFAAAFFDDLLEEREIIIRESATVSDVPPGSRTLAQVVSDPITVLVNQMLSVSDNMGAELLLKEIGLADSGLGSTDGGAAAIESLLRDRGFSVSETDVADGSGLSSENRVTCRLLVEVLEATVGTELHDGLAVAGETGTLRERMIGTPAEGRVRAKTGRLNEVGALAGTALAGDGTLLTFAWIGNTTDFYPVEQMIETQDRLVLELIEYPEGPTVDVLAPIG